MGLLCSKDEELISLLSKNTCLHSKYKQEEKNENFRVFVLMFKSVFYNLKWILYDRFALGKRVEGFSAHWNTRVAGQCKFSGFNRLYSGSRVVNSSLGFCTYISGARVVNTDVGAFCSIAPEVQLGGLGKHPVNFLSTHPIFYSPLKQAGITFATKCKFKELERTIVGSDVWIGFRAVILDGVKIGDGAIIAAGAIVTKDVEPYSIVGGVPARLIRKRFTDDIISELLEVKWWSMSLDELEKRSELFVHKENWSVDDVSKLMVDSALLGKE